MVNDATTKNPGGRPTLPADQKRVKLEARVLPHLADAVREHGRPWLEQAIAAALERQQQ